MSHQVCTTGSTWILRREASYCVISSSPIVSHIRRDTGLPKFIGSKGGDSLSGRLATPAPSQGFAELLRVHSGDKIYPHLSGYVIQRV